MKEINIAQVILERRRTKGLTQGELASYLGISKASVSKWETGLSYPDVTFLPQLAAYFNISIDELMGYKPQLVKEDIQKLYARLALSFTTSPFEQVIEECRGILKKYYSCYPLLLQIAVLYMNHYMLAESPGLRQEILEEATKLSIRVKNDSGDIWLSKDAASIEAACYLMAGQPAKILELFGETIRPISNDTDMIALAFQLTGNTVRAEEVVQISIYQHLLSLINESLQFMGLNLSNMEKVEEILKRTLGTAELFQLEKLHPNTMAKLYLGAAQIYCGSGNTTSALDMLERYVNLCIFSFFPFSLHGDRYFDKIDGWFQESNFSVTPPRSNILIRKSLLDAVSCDPAFACLAENAEYQSMLEKLKINLGGV